MCDYILAAVIFEGKEFGFNSRGSEYVGEATQQGQLGMKLSQEGIRISDTSGAYPDKRVLHAVRLGWI